MPRWTWVAAAALACSSNTASVVPTSSSATAAPVAVPPSSLEPSVTPSQAQDLVRAWAAQRFNVPAAEVEIEAIGMSNLTPAFAVSDGRSTSSRRSGLVAGLPVLVASGQVLVGAEGFQAFLGLPERANAHAAASAFVHLAEGSSAQIDGPFISSRMPAPAWAADVLTFQQSVNGRTVQVSVTVAADGSTQVKRSRAR